MNLNEIKPVMLLLCPQCLIEVMLLYSSHKIQLLICLKLDFTLWRDRPGFVLVIVLNCIYKRSYLCDAETSVHLSQTQGATPETESTRLTSGSQECSCCWEWFSTRSTRQRADVKLTSCHIYKRRQTGLKLRKTNLHDVIPVKATQTFLSNSIP